MFYTNWNALLYNAIINGQRAQEMARSAESKKKEEIKGTNPKDQIGSKKPAISLVPPVAILELTHAFKDGAIKYGRANWRKTPIRMTVYIDAALRHLLALSDGEERTRDSHVRHESAVMACMAIILDARAQGTLIDDRPLAGKFGDLLEEYTVEAPALEKGKKLIGQGLNKSKRLKKALQSQEDPK